MGAAIYPDDWIRPDCAVGSHIVRQGLEAASQSFKKGAPLVESSGYLAEATSGAALDIVGFALTEGNNDSSAGTSTVSYIPTELCPVWRGKLAGASPHTLAQTDLFTEYGLAKNSSGYWYVDYDESSAAHKSVSVVGLTDEVGTSNGEVQFVLNKYGNPYVD